MFNVFDCGGRGGKHRAWQDFGLPINYYLFEPEPDEFAELNSEQDKSIHILPYALGHKEGTQNLNIYSDKSLSSLLELNSNDIYRYKSVEKLEQISLNVTTLDKICSAQKIKPDFLSVDAQGTSLDIIRGAGDFIKDVMAIRCEVEFFEMYRHQKSVFELGDYLTQQGFSLVRIETCGPGKQGISTDMNAYSVSTDDAKPVWADVIFINQSMLDQILKFQPGTESALYLLNFLLHNSCGYMASEVFFKLLNMQEGVDYLSQAETALLEKFAKMLATYLQIPRRDYNHGKDYADELQQLNQFIKDQRSQDNETSLALKKIENLYL